MKDIFKQELPQTEISSIQLTIKIHLLFEKLRPLFKNPETGGPSTQAIDMDNIFHRINANLGYAIIMLETMISEVVIKETKRR